MKEFRFAIKNTVPIFFTYLFIGIAFGILMSDAGYGVLLSTASAFFIFAGSMQIVMVPMMTSGASLISIAIPYMILTLTDETYSLLCSVQYDPGLDKNKAAFLIAFLDHMYWVFGCFLGSCAGRFLDFDMEGIIFSATAFFLVVVVNQWRQQRSKLPFFVAIVCSAVFLLLLGKDYFIIPTLIACFLSLMILRGPIEAGEVSDDE